MKINGADGHRPLGACLRSSSGPLPAAACNNKGACVRGDGGDARHTQGLAKVLCHIPRLVFLASFSARNSPSSTAGSSLPTPPTAAVSTPLGTFARSADHPAPNLDPGYEGLEGRQRHRAAQDIC